MKLYFTYSKRLNKELLEEIKRTFTTLGTKVEIREQTGEEQQTYDFDEAKKMFQKNVKSIKAADVVLAECSYASSGLGYEISQAIDEKKPVIAIYNLNTDLAHPRHIKRVPISLKGNTSKYLILREYDIKSLKKTLELAVKDAKSLADTKFILIIPPAIDKYLEWNVKEKGISKAEITRQAVENMMKDDKAYIEYMKSFANEDEASNS